MRRPELLAPAGGPEQLATALAYGADAVYLGGPAPNLRAPGAGFPTWQAVAAAVATAHAAGARAYFCLNALPTQANLPAAEEALGRLADLAARDRPDALIIADPGVFALARRRLPGTALHLSTQANTANAAAAAFWAEQGAARVNLARELSMKDIRAMAETLAETSPGLELEAFVHGAMCMAVSGRCSLSAHMNRRPANQGLCTHPCRFGYRVRARLEERQRPGRDTWEAVEEDGYTSILAAEDLCLVRALPWLARLGLASVKIEGRMKSGGYLAHVTDVYATALTDLQNHTWRPDLYLEELLNTASRPLCTGFFLPGGRQTAWHPPTNQHPILAHINRQTAPDTWEVAVRSRWDATTPATLMTPGLTRTTLPPYTLHAQDGSPLTTAHSGTTCTLTCPTPHLRPNLYLRQGA